MLPATGLIPGGKIDAQKLTDRLNQLGSESLGVGFGLRHEYARRQYARCFRSLKAPSGLKFGTPPNEESIALTVARALHAQSRLASGSL